MDEGCASLGACLEVESEPPLCEEPGAEGALMQSKCVEVCSGNLAACVSVLNVLLHVVFGGADVSTFES